MKIIAKYMAVILLCIVCTTSINCTKDVYKVKCRPRPNKTVPKTDFQVAVKDLQEDIHASAILLDSLQIAVDLNFQQQNIVLQEIRTQETIQLENFLLVGYNAMVPQACDENIFNLLMEYYGSLKDSHYKYSLLQTKVKQGYPVEMEDSTKILLDGLINIFQAPTYVNEKLIYAVKDPAEKKSYVNSLIADITNRKLAAKELFNKEIYFGYDYKEEIMQLYMEILNDYHKLSILKEYDPSIIVNNDDEATIRNELNKMLK